MALSALFCSCGNELVVMAPYKDIPIVYCVLNPKEETQYLRLEKSFLGEASALEMARFEDSIYYPGATVMLERWSDGKLRDQFPMERIVAEDRDSGIFLESPNYLYKVDAKLVGNSEYRLAIQIPSTGAEVSARTRVVSEFRVIRPETFKKNLAFSSYDNVQTVEWISAPYTRIYHLAVRFHYLEIYQRDTIRKTADWSIAHYTTDYGNGGQTITADILHRNFYKWLGNKLDKPASGMIRLAEHQAIDFIFTVGGEELYTYMQIYGEDSGIQKEKPVFTNIVNGVGLFSSRFRQEINGKSLTGHSIDSLAHGIYTRNLGFDDSKNEYYHF